MYLIGFLPAFCWGIIAIIVNLIKTDTKKQVFSLALGAFLLSLIFAKNITIFSFFVGLISGLFWVIGFYYQTKCLKKFSVSTTIPISTAMQIIGTALVGVIIFREWEDVNQYILGSIYILLLIIGVCFTSYKEQSNEKLSNELILNLIISTIGFVVYATIMKFFNIDLSSGLTSQALGMLIGSLILNKDNLKGLIDIKVVWLLISGVSWFIGNISMFYASIFLGVTVAFSLSQLNVAVSTSLAILILKEPKTKKELVFVTIGVILIILSGILIAGV